MGSSSSSRIRPPGRDGVDGCRRPPTLEVSVLECFAFNPVLGPPGPVDRVAWLTHSRCGSHDAGPRLGTKISVEEVVSLSLFSQTQGRSRYLVTSVVSVTARCSASSKSR